MTTVQIVASNLSVPVDSFRLDYVFQITLNSSVSFNVFVLSNNNVVYTRQMTLSGDDYKNWGNDDTYLINYVAKQLGFTVSTRPISIQPVGLPVTGNASGVTGNASGVTGNASGVTGNSSGVTGNASGVTGDSSGVTGDSSGVTGNALGVTGDSSGVTGSK